MTAAAGSLQRVDVASAPPDFEDATAEEILEWTYANHQRVAIAASFQAESSVLIDLACRVTDEPVVLTLDTGRLPEETHAMIDRVRRKYPIRLHVLSPDPDELATMIAEHGTMLFRESVDLRLRCCDVRKARPLARALQHYDAWVTGLRREHMPSRAATPIVAVDRQHGDIVKVAPLAGWSRGEVNHYIDHNHVPRHTLYAAGYTSIGCAPCTRPTTAGEDERAGRWWWERNGTKECGLHTLPVVMG